MWKMKDKWCIIQKRLFVRGMTMAKVQLEEIVSKIKDMRPLPVAVDQIIELTEDPKATIQDLEEVILKIRF